MKKAIISLLSISMTVIMVGCVGQSSGGDETLPTQSVAVQSPGGDGGDDLAVPTGDPNIISPSDIEDPVLEVEPSNDSPAAALQGGLNAYKSMDSAEFAKYFENGIASAMGTEEEPDEASLNHYKIVFENLSWTIRTETMDGNEGYVEVDILNGDYAKAMETVGAQIQEEMGEGADNDAYMQKLNELIRDAMADNMPDKPMNTYVYMTKTEDGWKISDDMIPLYVAVRGGGDFVAEAEQPEETGGVGEGAVTTDAAQPSESQAPAQ